MGAVAKRYCSCLQNFAVWVRVPLVPCGQPRRDRRQTGDAVVLKTMISGFDSHPFSRFHRGLLCGWSARRIGAL